MPLLSLPVELLVDIISQVVESFRPSEDCCYDTAPISQAQASSTPPPCTPSSASGLAHTCKLLRSLTVPFLYASVTVAVQHARNLHTVLTSAPDLALCIRTLTLFVSGVNGVRLLHGIIRQCTNLQHLRLDGTYATPKFVATLLMHVSPRSQLTLRHFEWNEIISYLAAAPVTLTTFHLENAIRARLGGPGGAKTTPRSLASVHTLHCRTTLGNLAQPLDVGARLARVLLGVRVLDVLLSEHTLVLLQTYAVALCLTELIVHFDSTPPLFCETVAQLAPLLRRFTAHGGRLCERVFAARWACVEYIDIRCTTGCEGVQTDELRCGLMWLVEDRPRAVVKVVMEDGYELVVRGRCRADVAGREVFAWLGGAVEDDGDVGLAVFGGWFMEQIG